MSTDRRQGADPFESIDVSSRDGFGIEVQCPTPTVIVLEVRGKLDLWTSLPLLEAILAAHHERPAMIAVDMSEVLSVDGTGLRMLVEASGHVEETEVRCVIICRAGTEVAGLLEQTDGHRPFSVYESVDDALGPWLDEAGELPAGV